MGLEDCRLSIFDFRLADHQGKGQIKNLKSKIKNLLHG